MGSYLPLPRQAIGRHLQTHATQHTVVQVGPNYCFLIISKFNKR